MLLKNLKASHQTLIDAPIKNNCLLSIVIPVQNEAEYLSKTLAGLSRQVDLNNQRFDPDCFEIIFFVNNSCDDSANIIRNWRSKNDFLTVHVAEENLSAANSNIGYVRRYLMNEAFLRLRSNGFGGGIISTTDGDTVVAPNWIAATIAEVLNGAEAVGGRILINPIDLQMMDSKCRAFHLRDTGYRLMTAELEFYLDKLDYDSLPRHHQHFNGSFAVTTAAFERAGGVPEVSCLEDVAFYRSLLRADARFRHSPHVRVQTSARREGRTTLGLSTQLNEWTIMGCRNDEYFVESATAIKRRFQERKRLRFLWNRQREKTFSLVEETSTLAEELKISARFLKNEIAELQTFGCVYENVLNEQIRAGNAKQENFMSGVEEAIYNLRLLLEKYRRGSGKKF